jgi:hypothetical protein
MIHPTSMVFQVRRCGGKQRNVTVNLKWKVLIMIFEIKMQEVFQNVRASRIV